MTTANALCEIPSYGPEASQPALIAAAKKRDRPVLLCAIPGECPAYPERVSTSRSIDFIIYRYSIVFYRTQEIKWEKLR